MRVRTISPALAVLAVLATSGTAAQTLRPAPPPPDGQWCATGPANDARVETLHRWVRARDQQLARTGKLAPAPSSTRIQNDIILLEATPSSLPFHHPFDLENRSVVFVPDGPDSFHVSTQALDYDDEVGASLHTFANDGAPGWHYRAIDIASFAFELGGTSHPRLYITAHNAIQFTAPPLGANDQFSLLDALSLDGPVVAPLLQTDQGTIFPVPEVFVKQSADAVTVTWRSGPSEWGFGLDIQARLEATGRIVFSYWSVDEFAWGTVLVTTGTEPWRTNRERLFSQGEEATGITGSVQQMLDIRSIAVDRIGDSNVLEITISVTARLRPESLTGTKYLGYWIDFTNASGDGDWIMLYITKSNVQYRTPDRGWVAMSPAATIDGNTIRMRVLQNTLNLTSPSVNIVATTLNADSEPPVDTLSGTFSSGAGNREFGADVSVLAAGSRIASPVLEPFMLGTLNPGTVWSQVRSAYDFSAEQVDAVAIYQDFYTDIVLFAGAYSTVGNPGVDGVSNRGGYGTRFPRSPALLHMNRVGYRWNADLPRSWHVTSHELGHRWLYFINFDTGSGPSNALQPLGGHPAQYVHTPSAFDVYTDRDSSTMGGSNFEDHGNGTFSTPPQNGYYGYSWHDLYLMGLAAPEEVEDWYYIQDTSPALGGAYYPPPNMDVSGVRRNVSVDDVIRAMGPRNPTVATSQKRFKVVYVLLSLSGTDPSGETIQKLNEQREWFERMFRVATGHRAEVDTTLVPVRRRGVRLP